MSIHNSGYRWCRKKRTVILVGEGPMEWAFLHYLVKCFRDRNGPVAVRADNANGGSPGNVIQTARNLLRQRDYDVCVILMDTDMDWPAKLDMKIGRTKVMYVPASPCLEGLLLRIVGHAGITTSSTVDQCKRALYDNYIDKHHRTDPRCYEKSFPKDLLMIKRANCNELETIIGVLINA